MLDINKCFGAVTALKGASLSLMPGEIRALLGSNGSGKSTLVKILGGMVRKDSGQILLNDKPLSLNSPHDSRCSGVALAYQDLSLVPRMTVGENIMLGREPRRKSGFVDLAKLREQSAELLEKLNVQTTPDAFVKDLDPSTQSLVEVAKALVWKPRILVLDEVTASLHHDQVHRLFSLLKEMREDGLSILFVSHRFDEVFALCDSATILRGGETVNSVTLSGVDNTDLIYFMTGKRPEKAQENINQPIPEEERQSFLSIQDLYVVPKVKGVSMRVKHGEIVGIGGLQGQGQAEFLRAVYGAVPFARGCMEIEGTPVKLRSPADAVRLGVGFISGDRDREGIFSIRSVTENLFIAKMALKRLVSFLKPKELQLESRDIIKKLNIVAGSDDNPANSLSGGNQQKLIVGRWLMTEPRLLLLDDPTKGVDISSRREVHDLLRQMTKSGTTVLISSSDNEELLEISDRIYVFYEGRITQELSGGQMTGENLVSAMLGMEEAERKVTSQ